MRNLALAAACTLALTGAAYAAQTQATQPPASTSAESDQMKSLNQNNLRQEIQDRLAKAGFTSIKIMPSSFYVQAHDKKGDPVAMVIGPDSFTEVTEIKSQASNAPPSPPHGAQTEPGAAMKK